MESIKRDLWAGGAFLIFCLLYIVLIPSQTSSAEIWGSRGYGLTGRTLPLLIGAVLLIAIVAFMVETFFKKKEAAREGGPCGTDDEVQGIDIAEMPKIIIVSFGMLLYTLLLPVLGYWLTTAILVFVITWYLGNRSWVSIVTLSAGFTYLVFWIFIKVLAVPLPYGIVKF